MDLGVQDARRSPNSAQRPHVNSTHSASLPSTPRQQPRDYNFKSRSPSPRIGNGGHSPRSVSSESNRAMPSLRPINPACRYQSTQTSRRRINYNIGSDPLDTEPAQQRRELDPSNLLQLETRMSALYQELLPTPDSKDSRHKVVDKLKRILSKEWPDGDVNVVVFGSSGNLLCTSKSDVDICITMRGLETVCALADVLAKRGMRNVTCVHAKSVPIVKLWDPELQLACDLNVNNHVAIKNTRMVKTYMEIDERVRVLAMIVKYWTKQRVLNEASGGTLSSYTWTLLVIYFLQTRKVPILPVISLRDDKGHHKHDFTEDLERHRGYGRSNAESIAELLFHFFRRYGHELDYENTVVSVRQGKPLSKREKNWHLATNNRLCVEEPFNTERNLGNTADDTAVRGLHLELRQAFVRLAAGDDLASRVCEKFEFPKEEYRAVFEKPHIQPRPVLSRSSSHSSRANRNQMGGKNNRNRNDNRHGGVNGRRSSSAAAFGSNSFPSLGSPRQMIVPATDYFFQQQRSGMSSDDLARLKQQLSAEEQQLRYRQLLMSQASVQASVQEAQAAANQKRGANSPMPNQRRTLYNGYPSPRVSAVDPMPGSTSSYHTYSANTHFESPVSMSHTSSHQGTSTNPPSPLLPSATSARRGFQRAPDVSPGAAIRSHSQPARPLAPPFLPPGGSHSHYTSAGAPQHYQLRSDQSNAPGVPRLVYGPFMGPSGPYYVYAAAETVPREYLGYGIGGGPPYTAHPPEPSPNSFHTYDEMMKYYDAMNQRRGQTSPGAKTLPLVGSNPTRQRSPSPLAFDRVPEGGMKSAPLKPNFSRQADDIGPPRPAEDPGPIIVNGSYHTSPSLRTEMDWQRKELRRVSDAARPLRHRPNFFADDSDSESNAQPQSHQQVPNPRSSDITQKQHSNGLEKINLGSSRLSLQDVTPSSSLQCSSTSQSGPEQPQSLYAMRQTSNEAPTVIQEALGQNHDRHKVSTASARHSIAPLDLSTPAVERPRDNPSGVPVLSPVEETRTPSPSSTRKADSRRHSQLNGSRSSRDSIDTTLMPPPPAPSSKPNNKEGQNGPSHRESLSNATLSSFSPSPQITSSNAWQQAGRNSRKKENRKSRGEPMPANEAERKGG